MARYGSSDDEDDEETAAEVVRCNDIHEMCMEMIFIVSSPNTCINQTIPTGQRYQCVELSSAILLYGRKMIFWYWSGASPVVYCKTSLMRALSNNSAYCPSFVHSDVCKLPLK